MKSVLLLWLSLFQLASHAQTTLAGRVLDHKSGKGLPGVTILQAGTTNGVSSGVDGNFMFSVLGVLDSVTLVVSSVGYATQQRWVAASSNTIFRLVPDTRGIVGCPVIIPKMEVGLISGVRYAPLGGTFKLLDSKLIRLPLTFTASYQTNLGSNHALNIGLELPDVWRFHRVNLTETLHYQRLRAPAANTSFDSYSALLGLNTGFIGNVRLPTILLGGGYAKWQPNVADALPKSTGYGYTLGLRGSFLPLEFYGSAQATRWPEFWQWQGILSHSAPLQLRAGVAVNKLGSYRELSVLASRSFY